jgi:hypothetical protein
MFIVQKNTNTKLISSPPTECIGSLTEVCIWIREQKGDTSARFRAWIGDSSLGKNLSRREVFKAVRAA